MLDDVLRIFPRGHVLLTMALLEDTCYSHPHFIANATKAQRTSIVSPKAHSY